MIAKLEWTQSNAQQNKEQLRNPTMVLAFNNESTTTEAQQKSDNVVLRFCCPQLILQNGPIVKCKENYTFEGGGASAYSYSTCQFPGGSDICPPSPPLEPPMGVSKVVFVLFQQHDARIIITACYEDKARLLLCHVSI